MSQLFLRLAGMLMLAAFAVAIALAVRDMHRASSGMGAINIRLHTELVYAGLAAAGWLVCSVAVSALTGINRFGAKKAHRYGYEDHPKMSPSVQPAHVEYEELLRG